MSGKPVSTDLLRFRGMLAGVIEGKGVSAHAFIERDEQTGEICLLLYSNDPDIWIDAKPAPIVLSAEDAASVLEVLTYEATH